MKKALLIVLLLCQTSTFAQARAGECTPIGQTADGKLIYSLKCKKLPGQASVAVPPSQTEAPSTQRQGLFGLSFGSTDVEPNSPNPPSPN
ncbi:hypothetical protein DES32_0357 [Methylovirgula ligni]|uniref:Uncharacterized protein n=1 Tax=Methylovirgula ligni TaxID=569860 RepID=A0A3D9Z1U9_9HYPH|nr:hypothetical protein [Methylovirgula ligni]REF89142.1 hypothetical protein DES32_0357 [Methylovirgula ligni]